MTERTNEEWLQALNTEGPERDDALSDLRILLASGLNRGLLSRVETSAPEFESQTEDFVQEALLRILDKIDSFAGRSKFTTWAHKITIHVALTELRRKRWRDSSLNQLTERDDGDYTPSYTADSGPAPHMVAERSDLLSKINRIIAEELTEKQRTVMRLSVIQDEPTAVVARTMNMKPNAVYKLLHDSRMRLKERLLEEGLTPAEVLSAFE